MSCGFGTNNSELEVNIYRCSNMISISVGWSNVCIGRA